MGNHHTLAENCYVPEPNFRLTSDQSVNSSLSVMVQKQTLECSIYTGLIVGVQRGLRPPSLRDRVKHGMLGGDGRGGGWSKDILEFQFGPNLGLRT